MLSVSKVAKILGVARSTLIYYERKGIVKPKRNQNNGYREYSTDDLNKLKQLKYLQSAGFSLIETVNIVDGELEQNLIRDRLFELNQKIEEMITAREVIKFLLTHAKGKPQDFSIDEHVEKEWHATFAEKGSDAYFLWLKQLGLDEKEALYTKWVTRSILNTDEYMKDFFKVYEKMKRQGPGSQETTRNVVTKVKQLKDIKTILDIGCGKGQSSLILASELNANVDAIDNHQPFLDYLTAEAERLKLSGKVKAHNMSMFDIRFEDYFFDLIWSEGSAYFMGFENALKQWRRLLKPRGILFVSEAVWLTEKVSPECRDYWKVEYPNMKSVDKRKSQAVVCGYEIKDCFELPRSDWELFFEDMERCVNEEIRTTGMTKTYKDILKGIEIEKKYGGEYGYLCMLLQRTK